MAVYGSVFYMTMLQQQRVEVTLDRTDLYCRTHLQG